MANRAATWAKQQGAVRAFVQAVYRRQFAHGADITRADLLAASAVDAGLESNELLHAVQRQEVKDALRQATDEGWDRGVRGVPAVRSGRAIFFGDDRLEEAAAHVRSTRAFTRPSGA